MRILSFTHATPADACHRGRQNAKENRAKADKVREQREQDAEMREKQKIQRKKEIADLRRQRGEKDQEAIDRAKKSNANQGEQARKQRAEIAILYPRSSEMWDAWHTRCSVAQHRHDVYIVVVDTSLLRARSLGQGLRLYIR